MLEDARLARGDDGIKRLTLAEKLALENRSGCEEAFDDEADPDVSALDEGDVAEGFLPVPADKL